MATLSGNKIKDTYQSLVKFSDNGNITVGAKQLTDGFGNNSPMFVSTTQVGIGVTPESGLNLHVYGDAKIGSNLTVIGNLVVEGSTTTVGTDTLTVKDPLIVLANNNTSTDAVDIGFYGKYTPSGTTLYSGLFREALTGKYRLFKDLQVEPTTTVNTSGTGYAQATLIAALEGNVTGNVTGNLTGNVTGGSITATTGLFTDNVNIAGTLVIDDELTVEGSAFGRIEIGGASGGYIDLKAPHSDDYDLRLITSTGGGELLSKDTLKFYTGATTDLALTIDTSQDATFEGGVTASSFSGNLTGNVTGNLTGNVTGNVTGGVTGDVTGNLTGNVTGDLTGNVTATSVLADGVTATTQSDGDNSTKVATTAYVDTAITGHDTLAEVLAGGNTSGANNIIMADNQKIYYGTDSDVEMYFDGATQFGIINDTGGGSIFLRSSSFAFTNGTNQFYSMSSTTHQLKSSGTTRLTVNASGADVNGVMSSVSASILTDLTVDTDTLFVDASEDSVGINTSNPSSYSKHELVITAPDEGGVTIASATNEAAFLDFSDGSAPKNFIRVDHDGDIFGYNSWGSHLFTIGEGVDSLTLNSSGATFAGNVNIGSSLSSEKLEVGGSIRIRVANTSSASLLLNNTDTQLSIENTGGNMIFTTAGAAEKLRIDSSGNVGIGTTSPTNGKLVIDSAANQIAIETGTAGDGRLNIGHFSNGTFIGTYGDDGGAADLIRFGTHSGDERMRIDSSGNVGIGGTAGDGYRLQVIGNSQDSTTISMTYLGVGAGALKMTSNGAMAFGVDNADGSTERMRIDSSGNVGIGTTTPNNILHISDTGATTLVRVGNNAAYDAGIYFNTSTDWTIGTDTSNSNAFTIGNSSSVGTSPKIVIQTGGNVGIGTASPLALLDVAVLSSGARRLLVNYADSLITLQGANTNANNETLRIAGDNLIFSTGTSGGTGTERMRITSGGEIQVGNAVGGSDSDTGTRISATNMRQSTSGTGAHDFHDFYRGTEGSLARVGNIRTTGTTTSYNTSSDYRLKEDLQDFTGLDMVSKIPVYDFKWKTDESRSYGVMAHELQEVLPDAVSGEKDAEEMQGVDYSKIVPLLVKSIQELKAEIETLKTQINN